VSCSFVDEEALPDLVCPHERGPALVYLQVVTTGVEVLPAVAFAGTVVTQPADRALKRFGGQFSV